MAEGFVSKKTKKNKSMVELKPKHLTQSCKGHSSYGI